MIKNLRTFIHRRSVLAAIVMLGVAITALVVFAPRRTSVYLSSHDLSKKVVTWRAFPGTSVRLFYGEARHPTPYSVYLVDNQLVDETKGDETWLYVHTSGDFIRSGGGEWNTLHGQLFTEWKQERLLQWSESNPEDASLFWKQLLTHLRAEEENAAYDLVISHVREWSAD